VLVHFWAIWCPVCRLGQTAIDAIARDSPVITVAVQSGDAPELRAYLREQGLVFPVLPDSDGTLSAGCGVQGFRPASSSTQRGESASRLQGVPPSWDSARLWLARHLE